MAEIVLGIFVYGTFAFHCIAAYIPFGIERRERKPSRHCGTRESIYGAASEKNSMPHLHLTSLR